MTGRWLVGSLLLLLGPTIASSTAAVGAQHRDHGILTDLTVTPDVASPGDALVVGGRCDAGGHVSIYFHAVVGGGATTPRDTGTAQNLADDGTFDLPLLVPTHFDAGAYDVSASCVSPRLDEPAFDAVVYDTVEVPVTIVGAPTGSFAVDLAPGAVRPGESTTFTGSCPFEVDRGLAWIGLFTDLWPDDAMPSGEVATEADGSFVLSLPIPADHPPGQFAVGIICRVGEQTIHEVGRDLTVLGVPAPVPPPPPAAAPATPVTATPTVTG